MTEHLTKLLRRQIPGRLAPPIGPYAEYEYNFINEVLEALFESESSHAADYINHIVYKRDRILRLHAVAVQLPNPLKEQRLGAEKRSFDTLVNRLSSSTPDEFELNLPGRTVMGRAMIDLLIYFWKLVGKAVENVLTDHPNYSSFVHGVEHALSNRIYNRMIADLLADVATNSEIAYETRRNGVRYLIRLWEDTSVEATSRNFAPLMESIWEARKKTKVVFGSMLGVHELFEMVRLGASSHFFEYFTQHSTNEEVVYAFKEFLFGVPYEVLKELEKEIEDKGLVDVPVRLDEHGFPVTDGSYMMEPDMNGSSGNDGAHELALRLYKFFKIRLIKAMGRRLTSSPGPKRTAEEFVLIYFLENNL